MGSSRGLLGLVLEWHCWRKNERAYCGSRKSMQWASLVSKEGRYSYARSSSSAFTPEGFTEGSSGCSHDGSSSSKSHEQPFDSAVYIYTLPHGQYGHSRL